MNTPQLKQLFEKLDVDKSGFIEGKEIVGTFRDNDRKRMPYTYEFQEEDWEAIILDTDVNGDRKIGYDEFVTLVLFPRMLSGFFDHPMTLFPTMLQKQEEGNFSPQLFTNI